MNADKSEQRGIDLFPGSFRVGSVGVAQMALYVSFWEE